MNLPEKHFDGEAIKLDVERDPEVHPLNRGVMAKAVVTLIGEGAWNQALNRAKRYFATQGLVGWRIDDGNTLLDVVPMPEPYTGEFGYRLSFAAVKNGEVKAIKCLFLYRDIVRKK